MKRRRRKRQPVVWVLLHEWQGAIPPFFFLSLHSLALPPPHSKHPGWPFIHNSNSSLHTLQDCQASPTSSLPPHPLPLWPHLAGLLLIHQPSGWMTCECATSQCASSSPLIIIPTTTHSWSMISWSGDLLCEHWTSSQFSWCSFGAKWERARVPLASEESESGEKQREVTHDPLHHLYALWSGRSEGTSKGSWRRRRGIGWGHPSAWYSHSRAKIAHHCQRPPGSGELLCYFFIRSSLVLAIQLTIRDPSCNWISICPPTQRGGGGFLNFPLLCLLLAHWFLMGKWNGCWWKFHELWSPSLQCLPAGDAGFFKNWIAWKRLTNWVRRRQKIPEGGIWLRKRCNWASSASPSSFSPPCPSYCSRYFIHLVQAFNLKHFLPFLLLEFNLMKPPFRVI